MVHFYLILPLLHATLSPQWCGSHDSHMTHLSFGLHFLNCWITGGLPSGCFSWLQDPNKGISNILGSIQQGHLWRRGWGGEGRGRSHLYTKHKCLLLLLYILYMVTMDYTPTTHILDVQFIYCGIIMYINMFTICTYCTVCMAGSSQIDKSS